MDAPKEDELRWCIWTDGRLQSESKTYTGSESELCQPSSSERRASASCTAAAFLQCNVVRDQTSGMAEYTAWCAQRPHLWRSLPPICRLFLVPSCLRGGLNRFNALVTVSPERRCSNSTHLRAAGPDPLILSLTDNSPLEVKCASRKRSSSLLLFVIKPYTGISESYDTRVGNPEGGQG